ncbi:MAG: hypothetical protein ACLP19_08855 [Xanthobacteraceae bacterium]
MRVVPLRSTSRACRKVPPTKSIDGFETPNQKFLADQVVARVRDQQRTDRGDRRSDRMQRFFLIHA